MTLNFTEFRKRASRNINIDLSSYKTKRVKRRINSLMDKNDIKDYNECLDLLKTDKDFKKNSWTTLLLTLLNSSGIPKTSIT